MKILHIVTLMLVFACVQTSKAQIPTATLKTLNGKTVRTDTLSNNGKPMIISFFATWCKPCNRELQAIHENYAAWQQETGVKLIAVSIDEAHNESKVKPMVDENGWDFEVLLDTNRNFMRAVGAKMIPYTLLVNGQGQVVEKHSGYTDGYEHTLIEKIRKMVKK